MIKDYWAGHDPDFTIDKCRKCGATYNEICDNIVIACVGPDAVTVGNAYRILEDAVIVEWDAWSVASAENALLRRIAEKLSGQRPEYLNQICTGMGQAPYLGTAQKKISTLRGPFAPAWSYWLNDARDALMAVDNARAEVRADARACAQQKKKTA